jgi:hypothetical protein
MFPTRHNLTMWGFPPTSYRSRCPEKSLIKAILEARYWQEGMRNGKPRPLGQETRSKDSHLNFGAERGTVGSVKHRPAQGSAVHVSRTNVLGKHRYRRGWFACRARSRCAGRALSARRHRAFAGHAGRCEPARERAGRGRRRRRGFEGASGCGASFRDHKGLRDVASRHDDASLRNVASDGGRGGEVGPRGPNA